MPSSPRAQPGFLRFMASRFVTNLAKQMILLVAMWQIYALTSKPLMLGLMGLVQGVPFILGSFWSGHLVDRHEKRTLIARALAALFVAMAALALVSRLPSPPLAALYGLIGVAALFTSLEMPAASSYLQILVPVEAFPKAAAWNLANYVGATVAGPVIGGFLLERISPAAVYALCAGGIAVGFALTLTLRRIPPEPRELHEDAWQSVTAGLRFVRSKRIIFAAMVLDSFAVLFGEVVFILPVFAERLHAGPSGLGILRAAPALGSCLVSFAQAFRPVIRIRWSWLQSAVCAFGACVIGFGLSTRFPLSVLFLMGGGMADGVSVIIRQSLYQLHTPDAYRGRVSSVSGVFISISNELGGFESGLAAQLLGPVPAVLIGGLITFLTVAGIRMKYPELDKESAVA